MSPSIRVVKTEEKTALIPFRENGKQYIHKYIVYMDCAIYFFHLKELKVK